MPVDLSALERLIGHIEDAKKPDTRPLMFTWGNIVEEDNRKGVLAGTDGAGVPMAKVDYRPAGSNGVKLTGAQKNNTRKRRGIFSGFGPAAAGLHNNLTSQEYRKLDGPPLAPRRQFSRAITNFKTRLESDAPDCRYIEGSWIDVVSTKGVAFLKYHFNGSGRLPVRDLRGIRPEGMEKAKRSAVAWMLDIIRMYGVKGKARAA